MDAIALKHLRAAFILWEMDVRANPDGFQTQDEQRGEPLEQAADGYISVICSYAEKAIAAEAPAVEK